MKVICPECGVIVTLIRGLEIPVHMSPPDGPDPYDAYDYVCDASGRDYEMEDDESEDEDNEDEDLEIEREDEEYE